MSADLYVLATSCTEPDEEFSSVHTLARAILARRDRLGGRPDAACIDAIMSRDGLPGAEVIAIRAKDGSCGGRGALLGYAFVPGTGAIGRLRQALVDVSARVH
jgi:hypothetical protein